ncbi:MAG: DEAD/DEAH box helicase [Microthrixaceae bacterium]
MVAPSAAEPTGPGRVIDELVEQWSGDPRCVHVVRQPARPGRTAPLEPPLDPGLAELVPHRDLWTHQARAAAGLRRGESVVLATGTGSGKSLGYQLAAAESALAGRSVLMVFPTKALARDQLRSLAGWRLPGVTVAAFDGDCSREERTWVRSQGDVVVTNPDMLHQVLLPDHGRWSRFLSRLDLVVVDELHVLRGVFGSHVGHVLRRLRRLAEHHGSSPTFAFASATIAAPEELASTLCGQQVTAITEDGAPRGPRTIVLWNPEAAAEAATAAGEAAAERWSLHGETALVAERLVRAGLRTLVFCRARRSTELVADELRRSLPGDLAAGVRSYRGGYLADERRRVEAELADGSLSVVVATNALELGVDIGGLDAVVLSGYPGTTASFRQQVGRSGREHQPSLAVLVSGQDQLDQWMARHPDALTGRPIERSVVNLANPEVMVPQVGCAAAEWPLRAADHRYWGDGLDEAVAELVRTERARVRHGADDGPLVVWSGRGAPAPTIGLRSASSGEYRIRTGSGSESVAIATIDRSRVASAAHPGAIYLHQGRAWRVERLEHAARTVVVRPDPGDTYTQTRSTTDLSILATDRSIGIGVADHHLGEVEVTTQVIGYQIRDASTHEVLDRVDLGPEDGIHPSVLRTRAVWTTYPQSLIAAAGVTPGELPGALHAAEHAAIGILPLFAICDRWDVGGVSTALLEDTGQATVCIHDAHPGGSGIADLAFEVARSHLEATAEVLRQCPCEDGCPGCVQSPKCGNGNEPLDKAAARRLLERTLSTSG